jgi:DNA-binding GntR family transcriptional regulator
MILTGKLEKGESLSYEMIVHDFNVSREVAHRIISQLKKDELIISKWRKGSLLLCPLYYYCLMFKKSFRSTNSIPPNIHVDFLGHL